MRAAIQSVYRLHTMTDNAASTMGAGGRQGMGRALETVEHMRLTTYSHLKAFIVDITAHLTGRRLISQRLFILIHSCLFLGLLPSSGLRLFDVLVLRSVLSCRRLRTFRHIRPILGLEAVAIQMDWFRP